MPINEPLTITLTHELSDRVRAEIATGGYKNPIDVIAGGLDASIQTMMASSLGCAKTSWRPVTSLTAILRK